MLDDLDTVDWAALSHAYGAADDVPPLLRALAEGDSDALDELYGNIWHQGTVYEATPFAVPFLVRILEVPGVDVVGVLRLLSAIAQGSSYLDVHRRLFRRSTQDTVELREQIATELAWVAAARTAVAAGLPTVLRLLAGDPDENVRAAAVYTIGVSAPDGDLTPALLDPSGLVRATAVLMPGTPDAAVEACLADPEPLPRLAAAIVLLADPVSDALVEVIERDAPAAFGSVPRLPMDPGDPLAWVLRGLTPRWDLQVRLVTAWMRNPDDTVRGAAVAAVREPIQTWRPAAVRLVPALAVALLDPCEDVRRWAGMHLADGGSATAVVADELWAAVERGPFGYHETGTYALTALSRLHDPRADAYLSDRLADPELDGSSAAVEALGPWSTRCRAGIVDAIDRVADRNDRIGLIRAAARMGVPADELVPVLRRYVPSLPHSTSRVLGDLGPAAVEALPELTALRTDTDPVVRINAARAVWRITGDVTGLLPLLRADIGRHHALQVLAEVGPEGAALADLLPPMFDSDDEWREVCAALAYWHLTADATPVVPVLIRHTDCQPRGLLAVRGLADIGPAAAAAIPVLRDAVDSPYRQTLLTGNGTTVQQDEEWADLCAAALTRIVG